MGLQELTVERYEGVADDQRILLLRGPITIETAPQFDRAVHHESAETMILDLSDVPYIDSVGLGSLVAACVSHQKTGRCLVLTGVKPRVRKIMEITKLNDFFFTAIPSNTGSCLWPLFYWPRPIKSFHFSTP